MHRTGWLYNDGRQGAKFDSKDRNDPFQFGLGQGMVIRGWDEGAGHEGRRHARVGDPGRSSATARGAGGVIRRTPR